MEQLTKEISKKESISLKQLAREVKACLRRGEEEKVILLIDKNVHVQSNYNF